MDEYDGDSTDATGTFANTQISERKKTIKQGFGNLNPAWQPDL